MRTDKFGRAYVSLTEIKGDIKNNSNDSISVKELKKCLYKLSGGKSTVGLLKDINYSFVLLAYAQVRISDYDISKGDFYGYIESLFKELRYFTNTLCEIYFFRQENNGVDSIIASHLDTNFAVLDVPSGVNVRNYGFTNREVLEIKKKATIFIGKCVAEMTELKNLEDIDTTIYDGASLVNSFKFIMGDNCDIESILKEISVKKLKQYGKVVNI